MPTTESTPSISEPGVHKLSLGGQRFTLSIPLGIQTEQPMPFILALHYAGHGMPYYGLPMITELVGPAFESLQALILAPDCTAEDWNQPQSEDDLKALLDHLENAYNIDPVRRLVTGYSMGGIGTWHWAATYPQRFRAAIVMAGMPPQNMINIEWQIPLLIIHSRQDELMPYHTSQQAVDQLQRRGVDIKFQALDDVTHFEVYRYARPLRDAIPWLEQKWGS